LNRPGILTGVKSVKIYTTPYCPYCVRAKRLLERKGVSYQEIDVAGDDEARIGLEERTGRRTVPRSSSARTTSADRTTCTISRTRASWTPCCSSWRFARQ